MSSNTVGENRLGVDVYDPDVYTRAVPHADFAKLRREAPVYFHPEPPGAGKGFWAITKHSDIVDISRDPASFSSFRGGTNHEEYDEEDLSVIRLMLINMDPPQHVKFRRIVSRGFTPRQVGHLHEKIQDRVRLLIDQVADAGECDFVRSIAAELPLQVIAELMGVPQEDRQLVFDWSNRLIGFDDPEFQTSLEDGRQAAAEMFVYANSLAERRKEGGKDLVNVLLSGDVDGENLTEAEFDSFFLLIAVAGNETTRNAISGGLLALLEHPDQLQRLRARPELVDSAVEEILRWVSPLTYFRRTAMRDVELRGQTIRDGDKVALFYPSGNRDEEVFPEPERFDVGRTPNDHLAFGAGEHFCLGSHLARIELQIMFRELIARMDDIELTGPIRRLRSNFINGIKSMPIRFKTAR